MVLFNIFSFEFQYRNLKLMPDNEYCGLPNINVSDTLKTLQIFINL